jgi:RHS repeat-associated protein
MQEQATTNSDQPCYSYDAADLATTAFHTCVFCAQVHRDTESGLDYMTARYYAPTMGRFMSPDWSSNPVSIPFARLDNPQTLNLYGYVGNNPLRYFDRYGHSTDCNHDGDKSVVCIVTTVIDKVKNWFSGGSNSNSSGNTQAATPAPSPDPQFRV